MVSSNRISIIDFLRYNTIVAFPFGIKINRWFAGDLYLFSQHVLW